MSSQAPASLNRRTLAGVSVLTRSSGASPRGVETSGRGALSSTSTLRPSVRGLLPAALPHDCCLHRAECSTSVCILRGELLPQARQSGHIDKCSSSDMKAGICLR